ncbi:MAG TPA: DNA mismatch endonuclease Vsr [Tepidisphaeraceae bacterium]|jgi:DNA mismatch endonuclease (patch repair protein)|nr:DNA mismatch endonuclease Vsr [Tepidisphaeraceae bacterium]
MPEKFTKAERSRIMAAVKSRDTKPELLIRRLVHRLGYRFRLHRRDLPGTPDIVLPRLRKIINVHGCFWHMHSCRHAQRAPRANALYWRNKRLANARRDRRNLRRLRRAGWEVLVIWECQLKDVQRMADRIRRFLAG